MKAITIKIAFLIIYSNIYSQFNIEINTPKGTDVAAKDYVYLYGGDYEDPERASVDNYWLTRSNVNSNEVEIIERSTLSYNCHSYAWHVSEGGVRVWVDDWGSSGDIDNVNRYWDDGSYTETTQTNHRKVFYHPETQFDHSAVTTNQNGWFISKWTDGPLIKHRYDNCPYWNSAVNLKYYKLSSPVISNSTTAICKNSQRTFASDPLNPILHITGI
jgi:hypothetical protein